MSLAQNPAIEIVEGMITIDTIRSGVRYANVHVRVEPQKGHTDWEMLWGDTKVKVMMPDSRDQLYGYSQPTKLKMQTTGEERECEITTDPGPFSLKLVYDGYRARLLGGYSNQTLCFEDVPFPKNNAFEVVLNAAEPLKCRRITSNVLYAHPRRVRYEDIDSIIALHIDDPIVGIWEYLDRDIEESKASLGGKYTLAILPSEGGKYDMVYLSGGLEGEWKIGDVKGALSSSGFSENYDLAWIDVRGIALNDDNEAQLMPDLGILVLRLPVYKSQIRFRKR